jgi:cell division protein FtsW
MLIPYFIIFSIAVFLIAVLQKDLGQVVLLGSVLFVMLIFANRSAKLFVTIISTAVIGIISLILLAPHRINRLQSWWSSVQDSILTVFPESIATVLRVKDFPEPYQVSNSLNAMYHGGWFGVDLSNGALKLGFLSEVHTDFVLAGITEEIGLVGLFFIIVLFITLVLRILRISRRIENPKYHLFSLGISVMLVVAFIINSYGVSGIIPIKGIAVPFLSYGGSSVLSLGVALGLVLSISTEMKKDT